VRAAGLCAFVPDGALLPRASGASDEPLASAAATLFASPATLAHTFEVPYMGSVRGLGVPRGVTAIVGGGFHGKSTLLAALERAVYPHAPGDGRELVVCSERAVKVRAEDGRSVGAVDLRPLIGPLPGGRDTRAFTTTNASGSTSQAASIVEALEAGADTLLMDEDTSASNLLARDARMAALVPRQHEPITGLVARARELFVARGVSTIIVVGSQGDWLGVSDLVLQMLDYACLDVTERAKQIARGGSRELQNDAAGTSGAGEPPPEPAQGPAFGPPATSTSMRRPQRAGFLADKVVARRVDALQYGEVDIALAGVEQLVGVSQTRAVGEAMHWLVRQGHLDGKSTITQLLAHVEAALDSPAGLDAIALRPHTGNLARPRRFEIAAAMNRLRSATWTVS
jgi:predicted ABC-class ATPase